MRSPNDEDSQFSKFQFPWNKEEKIVSNSFFREYKLYQKTLNPFKVVYHPVSCLLHLHILICPILIWPAEKARIFPDNMLSPHMPQQGVLIKSCHMLCSLAVTVSANKLLFVCCSIQMNHHHQLVMSSIHIILDTLTPYWWYLPACYVAAISQW